jgi:site-specific DNA-methyltransferase (adenine-specific)
MDIQDLLDRVFNDDVFNVLKKIPDNSVDTVFGDPDYNVNINYTGKKYTMEWNKYIEWYIELNKECLRILKPDGNIFMINYPQQNAYLQVKYLDENAYKVYNYVWVYNTPVGHSHKHFTNAHRSILHIVKSENNKFYKDNVAIPYR